MQVLLRLIAIISFIVAIAWVIQAGAFEPEPILAFLGGLTSLVLSFRIEKQENKEALDARNRGVMLDHVENFWVKGILEKSLHSAALLELGIKEDPNVVNYPWTIKRESTEETLPAGKSMLEIFQEIGMGRSLLILGAPGSGKTIMLLELTRQLIQRARQGEKELFPVVFNLSSWREKQTLTDWLVEQLNIVYNVPKQTASAWVNENRMFLLLDGLDEVRGGSRVKCVEAINHFRKEHGLVPLVVCSRIVEYKVLNARLSFNGAVTIQPLTLNQIEAYFERFGKPLAAIKEMFSTYKVLQELAQTPLMLSVMALAYKDLKADELLTSQNIEEQRKHLFNTYLDHMFERSTHSASAPFTKQQTLHYLSWLARTMTRHNVIAYQLESMQPSWIVEQPQFHLYRLILRLTAGMPFGLGFGLLLGLLLWQLGEPSTGLLLGLSEWLPVALIMGLIAWLGFGRDIRKSDRISMVDKLTWSWRKAQGDLFGGLIFGLFIGLASRLGVGLNVGLSAGLGVGMFGLIGLIGGLNSEEIEETSYPAQRLKQSLISGLLTTVIFGLLFGILIGLMGGLFSGLLAGLSGGLMLGFVDRPSIGQRGGYIPLFQHYSLRLVLVRHHLLPRQLISFLEYCISLIFLRRVGGSYIFVHRLLMEHFAEMGV